MDALERDFYEERRRRWRRGAFWKGFLVAAVLGGVVAALAWSGSVESPSAQIARVDISGVIVEDDARDRMLRAIAEDGAVRALILRVNSPGGTTVGAESLFAAVRAVAAAKPVVATMGEAAASGGYVAAIAADHVLAWGNTLTGSIGVILEYPDLTGLLARLSIGVETVRSSPLKGEPSPFRPTPPVVRVVEDALIADSYAWFRGLVGERRGLDGPALDAVANGQVFTGRMALERDLVDGLGGEVEARAWLESRDAGLADLPVRDWESEEEGEGILGRLLGQAGSAAGILRQFAGLSGPKLLAIAP